MKPKTEVDITPAIGGLATKMPPTTLPATSSPDLLNVMNRDGAVVKRGGFQPLFRDQAMGDAVKNVAWRTIAKESYDVAAPDGDYVVSPGLLIAGHRSIFESSTDDVLFDFMFRPDDLRAKAGGNGYQSGSGAPYDGAPYEVILMPIISKGPLKKSDQSATTTASNEWGAHSNSGMPFCVYLWNAGTGTDPIWTFRLAAHAFVGGSWTLQIVESAIEVVEGATYHFIANITTSRVALRVRRIYNQMPWLGSYTEDETTFTATAIGWNKCPIQVFDCPQKFVEATAVGSATQRPGLFIGTTGSGRYWFAKQRPEATIDDLAFWDPDPGYTLEDFERSTKLDTSVELVDRRLLNHWDFNSGKVDYMPETTGRGNHLFIAPRGPVSVADDGGKEGGSWWYNGLTSYAQLDCDRPCWQVCGPVGGEQDGAFFQIVRDNMPHGLNVEFWVDSIEPRWEQVLAEIHSVMYLAIRGDGKLVGYCRDGSVSATPASFVEAGAQYQGPVVSTNALEAGRRYSVSLMRSDDGATLSLYIDGALDTQSTGLHPANYQTVATTGNSYPPAGVTLGIGSLLPSGSWGVASDYFNPNRLNTDTTKAFCGRIETFRILLSEDAATRIPRQGPEDSEDWSNPEERLWMNNKVDVTTYPLELRSEQVAPVRTGARGSVARIADQYQSGAIIPFALSGVLASLQGYQLVTDNFDPQQDLGGHQATYGIGARIAFVLCYYRFNFDDRREQSAGQYIRDDWTWNGSWTWPVGAPGNDSPKLTHQQQSQTVDDYGALGAAARCCTEYDIPNATGTPAAMRKYMQAIRPFNIKSPRELGVQWTTALVPSAVGQVPVTLMANYDVQTLGKTALVAGACKTLYWAKPQWDDGNLLFPGGDGSFAVMRINPSSRVDLQGTGSKTPVELSMWVKPNQLGGLQLLAASRGQMCAPFGASFIMGGLPSWSVMLDHGALQIVGMVQVAGQNCAWQFVEAVVDSAGTGYQQHNTVKVGVWNHIRVVLGATSVTAYVNGDQVSLLNANSLTGALRTEAYTAGSFGYGNGIPEFYLGGSPEGAGLLEFGTNSYGNTHSFDTACFNGYVADVWVQTGTVSSHPEIVPKRGAINASALYQWLLDEASGWTLANVASSTSAYSGDARIRELIPFAFGLRQEEGRRYDYVAFRDSLIVTNGAEDPQIVKFLGLGAKQTWDCHRLGMAQPVLYGTTVDRRGSTAGTDIPAGGYIVAVTFLDADGNESDAVVCGTYLLSAAVATLTLKVDWLPRSPEHHVVKRRVYASTLGGGTPIFNVDIEDNESIHINLEVYASSGTAADAGTRQPAPRARHCAIAGSSLCLADLPDVASGQNSFAFSTNANASYFPTTTTVILDSEDGKPIVGVSHNLGQVFFSKRDSVYRLDVGAIFDANNLQAEVRLVQASDGIGGGDASANNLIYGSGDRGVFIFDNTNLQYLSEAIEPTWRTQIDRTNLGLYKMQGAFWRDYSQYWLSYRGVGEDNNTRVLVFDMASAGWGLLEVVDHFSMHILNVLGNQELAIGTGDGRIYRYVKDSVVDDVRDVDTPWSTSTIAGTVASNTEISLTLAGDYLDFAQAGPRGVRLTLTYTLGAGGTATVERTVVRGFNRTMFWDDPLPDMAGSPAITAWSIGKFDAYWSSPWLRMAQIGKDQNLTAINVELLPNAGDLTIDAVGAVVGQVPQRAFPTTGLFTMTRGMETGTATTKGLIREQKTAPYHRFRFGTYGARDPFALIGYSPTIDPSMTDQRSGRLS